MKTHLKLILRVFGVLLILTLSFFPYSEYSLTINESIEEVPPLGSYLTGEKGQYYPVRKTLKNHGFRFFPNLISDNKGRKEYLEWLSKKEEERDEYLKTAEHPENEEIFYLETEFLRDYGGQIIYKKIKLGFYLIQNSVVLVTAFLSFFLSFFISKNRTKLNCFFNKHRRRFFVTGYVAIVLSLILFSTAENLGSNLIQYLPLITLVFVTWSYASSSKKLAVQTKELAESTKEALDEQKGKRKADFNERRIDEFYRPFVEKLNNMRTEFTEEMVNDERIWTIYVNTRNLFFRRSRMVSVATLKKLKKIQVYLFSAHMEHPQKEVMIERFFEKEEEIRKIVLEEWDEIENEIRSFYGYFGRES